MCDDLSCMDIRVVALFCRWALAFVDGPYFIMVRLFFYMRPPICMCVSPFHIWTYILYTCL